MRPMLNKIPQSRALLYIFLAGLLPLFIAFVHFMSQRTQLRELENTLETVQHMAFIKEKKQSTNIAVREHFRDADHFYIDKHLETLVFLEPEIESLQKLINDKNFSDNEQIKKRLETLTGTGNSLIFTEGVVQSFPLFQETAETLVHPVEINISDLQKILAKVEGVDIGSYSPGPNRPQLLVIDFKIDKKKVSEKNEVFVLNMKLLKREFL